MASTSDYFLENDKAAEDFVDAIHEDTERVMNPNYRPRRRMRPEDDDRGSVQDCFVCGFAYFSRWETDKPFSAKKALPDPEDLVCEKCKTRELFDINMRKLAEQSH